MCALQVDSLAGKKVDVDGALGRDLEAEPRSGDPETTGVVWPTIVEISMVGALGCGHTLMTLVRAQYSLAMCCTMSATNVALHISAHFYGNLKSDDKMTVLVWRLALSFCPTVVPSVLACVYGFIYILR